MFTARDDPARTVVAQTLGAAYRYPAAQAFLHGYRVAVGVGAACLLAAAAAAAIGFRPAGAVLAPYLPKRVGLTASCHTLNIPTVPSDGRAGGQVMESPDPDITLENHDAFIR